MIRRSKTLFLLVLVAAGVGGGIGLGAGVYHSRTSQNCADLGCSQQVIPSILISAHYNSSIDGQIHFLIHNQDSSPVSLADIFIDNSKVNYTLSQSSGTVIFMDNSTVSYTLSQSSGPGSHCSETTSVVGPSAYCVVNAPAPNLGCKTHSVVIVTASGSRFSQNITA